MCNYNTHFQTRACRADLQTACQALTVCQAEQYQTVAKTQTSDRKCAAATACVAGQEEVNPLTTTSDRSCRVCPAGKTDADSNPSTPCVACGAGHYAPQGSTGSCDSLKCAAGSSDADSDSTTACVECNGITTYNPTPGRAGNCLAMEVCEAGEEVTDTGSTTINRGCQPCVSGAYSIASNSVSLARTHLSAPGLHDMWNRNAQHAIRAVQANIGRWTAVPPPTLHVYHVAHVILLQRHPRRQQHHALQPKTRCVQFPLTPISAPFQLDMA